MRKEYDFSKAKKILTIVVLNDRLQSDLMRKRLSISKNFRKKQKYRNKP